MITLDRGKYQFGLALLGLLYDNMQGLDENFFRTAKSHGVKFIRMFVARRDEIIRGEFDADFWARFDFVCEMSRKYRIFPIFTVYQRANRRFSAAEYEWLEDQYAPRANRIIGRGKWGKSLANEPSFVPSDVGVEQAGRFNPSPENHRVKYIGFEGPWVDPVAVGGNNSNVAVTRRLAGWYYDSSRRSESKYGIPLEYQFGCIRFDPEHPAPGHLQTSDPIISGLGGLWFGEDRKSEVSVESHRGLLPIDLTEPTCCGHIFRRARGIRVVLVSSDGSSAGNPAGTYLTIKGAKRFPEASTSQLLEFTSALYRLATKGVRLRKFSIDGPVSLDALLSGVIRYKYSILHEDLPRTSFVDTSAENPDNWRLDLREIDWSRYRRALPRPYWESEGCEGIEYSKPDPVPIPDPVPDPAPDPGDNDTPTTVIKRPKTWTWLKPRLRSRWPFILINFREFFLSGSMLDKAGFWILVATSGVLLYRLIHWLR